MVKVASTNVKIDPILNQKCSEDITNFCSDVGSGKSRGEPHGNHYVLVSPSENLCLQ